MPADFQWLTAADLAAIHDDQLRRFGGLAGVKSEALLESAVAAPLNHLYYADEADVLRLGAVLAHAIVRNHPFLDGNKRTATLALLEFLYLNGLMVDLLDTPNDQPLAAMVEALAARELDAAGLEERLRPFLVAR